jgi:hypothetical protein
MARILRGTVSYLSVLVLLVAATSAADPSEELLLALKEWEAATADIGQTLPDTALDAYRDALNAHELEAAAELLGPVSARRLVEEYRWTLERLDSGDICLHGEPRDVTTSLFFALVEVRLDGTTHQPASIQFFTGDGEPRPTKIIGAAGAALKRPKTPHQSAIRLVAGARDVPDEPAPPRPLELETILKRWQEAVGRIQNAEVRFHRYSYDLVYRSESRGTGRFLFEAPNLGAYERAPIELASDTRPARSDDGGTFTLQRDSATTIQWDGTKVWILNLDQKLYDVMTIPERPPERTLFGWNFFSDFLASPPACLPGVVEVTDEFLKRFNWSIARDNDQGLMLEGTPASNRIRDELKILQVLVDRASFRTTATRIISSTGARETTHVFQYVFVNDERVHRQSWVPDVSGLTNSGWYPNTDDRGKD